MEQNNSECPVCGSTVSLTGSTMKGELLNCNDCSSELEVVSVNPVSLEEAPQEEEDWGE